MKAYRPVCGLLLLSAILVVVVVALSVRLPEGKNWIDLMQAMGTPSVALLAAYFTWLNYQLTRAKRQDELFDRRWKFYCDFKEFWLSTGNGAPPGKNPFVNKEIILEWVPEAKAIVGCEVATMIANLSTDGHQGSPRWLESELEEAFLKTMRLAP